MTAYRLGINTCFAVKRWPRPEEWARIAADELGLDLVQHSLDLVDLDAGDSALAAQGRRGRRPRGCRRVRRPGGRRPAH